MNTPEADALMDAYKGMLDREDGEGNYSAYLDEVAKEYKVDPEDLENVMEDADRLEALQYMFVAWKKRSKLSDAQIRSIK